MAQFVVFLKNAWDQIWNVLHVQIDIYNGFSVYLSDVLVVLLIFGFVITVYWKGAKA